MTEEELAKLDEARAREAEAQFYEKINRPDLAKKIRAGQLELDPTTTIAARLARTGWMPPVDPRLDAAREIIARFYEIMRFPGLAEAWRNPAKDNKTSKAAISYLASCLPEGYSIADLPPVPEKDQ